jgi:hypothetical protein
MDSVSRAEGSLLGIRAISSHLQELGYPEKSLISMNKCGEESGNYIIRNCPECGVELINLRHRCNLRTCPVCAKKRMRRIRRRYLPALKKFPQTREKFFYFLTISPKNYDDFENGRDKIKKSFSKFIRLDYFKKRVDGGIWVMETKNTNDWNIHLHVIVYGRWLDNRIRGECFDCGQNLMKFDYINKKYFCANKNCNSTDVIVKKDSKLVSLWKKCSGEDVNIHISKQGSCEFTLNYMLKYISVNKDDFSSSKNVAIYINSTRKRKLINSFGVFFKLKFSKERYICAKCGCYIDWIFDYEVVELMKKSLEPPPPPLDFVMLSVKRI